MSKKNISVIDNETGRAFSYSEASNPLLDRIDYHNIGLNDYTQEVPRPKYDKDLVVAVNMVKFFNNMVPSFLRIYNFNAEEINGERHYSSDKKLILIREYDSDLIRDYYYDENNNNSRVSINKILEYDKLSGRLRSKVEPIAKADGTIKAKVTVFDNKINDKYIIIQVNDDGSVNSATEIVGTGHSFKTIFKNPFNGKPIKYIEGNNTNEGFEILECYIDLNGQITKIKKSNSTRALYIKYTADKKIIRVKDV